MFRAGRDWHADHLALKDKYRDAERTYCRVHQDTDVLHLQISNARHALGRARATFVRLDRQTEQWRDEIARAASRWGAHVPAGPEGIAATERIWWRREKAAPWADEEFTTARTELFLAALRLHKDFITAEAPTVRRNLSALMDVLDGRGPRPPIAAVLAAWQTFFLMPVVSSAFASIDRLMVFGTAGRGAFHGHDIWYDVESADARGHWIPAEGAALRDILNVAVTRARRRLYVIGNHRNWSRLPYFDVLADSLPVWWPPAG